MSTSTITRPRRRWRRYALAAATILTAWFAGIAIVTVIVEPTPSVVVVAPLANILRAAAASDAAIVDVHWGFSRLRSERPGFVRDLYRNGAWFVWPVIEGGCFFGNSTRG